MIPTFGVENLRLLCTDTDSLCYEIKQEQGSDYEDIWKKIADRDDTMMVFFVSYFFVSIKICVYRTLATFQKIMISTLTRKLSFLDILKYVIKRNNLLFKFFFTFRVN